MMESQAPFNRRVGQPGAAMAGEPRQEAEGMQ
jgi:hypothetical protein